jgi:hypothetical protein
VKWEIFGALLPRKVLSDPQQKGMRSTAQRLLRSRHFADLRLFVWIFMLVLLVVLLITAVDVVVSGLNSDGVRLFLTINAATVTLFVSLMSWAYQIGSKRRGVVDLFGCEIAAINGGRPCRDAVAASAGGGRREHGELQDQPALYARIGQ